MGILDDLKNQSQLQKAQEQQEQQRQAELVQYYQDEIQPKMLQLYSFINELVEHLNYLNKDTPVNYPVMPDGSLQVFNQSDYKVTIDSSNEIKNINLRFFCSLEKPLRFEIENEERIERYAEVLNSYRVPFDRKDAKDNDYNLVKATFEVNGPVTTHIIFKGDIENSQIEMLLTNMEKPGTQKHILKARHITETFIDGLGKYILRENPEFLKLEIDDEDKEKIRQRVQEEQQRRQRELEEAERLEAEDSQKQSQASWKNIFKKKS